MAKSLWADLKTLFERRGRRPVLLNLIDDFPTQALIPSGSGYRAIWAFDIDDSTTPPRLSCLALDVSRKQAMRIRGRDIYHEGFLEPVRAELDGVEALLSIVDSEDGHAIAGMPVTIDGAASEDEFVAWLDAKIDEAPQWWAQHQASADARARDAACLVRSEPLWDLFHQAHTAV